MHLEELEAADNSFPAIPEVGSGRSACLPNAVSVPWGARTPGGGHSYVHSLLATVCTLCFPP